MKTARKVLLLVLCAALLVSATVMGTLAYLTDSETVTNTFTVGNVAIVLDEADVDESKTNVTTDGRDKANKYHLMPGSSYEKDPTVWVDADSDDCYVFVKVENALAAFESTAADYTNIAAQIADNGWTEVTGQTGVYYKLYNADSTDADKGKMVVFENFEIAENAQSIEGWAGLEEDAEIKVTAYAIQLEGFENDVTGAWSAVSDAYAAQN